MDTTTHDPQCGCGHCMDNLLHRLWSKAVGTEGYDKGEWKRLSAYIEKCVYSTPKK